LSFGSQLAYPGSGNAVYCLRGGNYNTFYRFDGFVWTTLTNAPYTVSTGADLVSVGDGYLYATFGGRNSLFSRYSVSGASWQSIPMTPFLVDYGSVLTADSTGKKIYALAGYGFNTLEMPSFDTLTQRWDRFSGPGWVDNVGKAYVLAGDAIYSVQDSTAREFYKLDLSTQQWVKLGIMPGNTPNNPQSDQLLWTGSELLVLGRRAAAGRRTQVIALRLDAAGRPEPDGVTVIASLEVDQGWSVEPPLGVVLSENEVGIVWGEIKHLGEVETRIQFVRLELVGM
jgi:hypothetical protein